MYVVSIRRTARRLLAELRASDPRRPWVNSRFLPCGSTIPQRNLQPAHDRRFSPHISD